MDEGKLLQESLAVVKVQLIQLRRCLDSDQLMDGLKAASTMLGELRTSSLTPKQYYELYMSVFDALRHLSLYLRDAHLAGKHHLADLYELVQYAGNIVPRLYLMMTVGTVYMGIEGAPRKEIMKDMMEMARGVQHPTRGLFLRHYLSGMTKDYLPVGEDEGAGGNLQDSIGFVLTNFIEMNKLWVRLQHTGLSRDRERRELERRELRILVGTNLVRLSQLDGVDLDMYRRTILPNVLEQVVNCRDIIAQEYLMEVVIQVFTDEFHLRTLSPFLSAVAQLHPKVTIKSIVIALIDRLAAYAAREAESESPEDRARQEVAAKQRLEAEVKRIRAGKSAEKKRKEEAGETEGWGAAAALDDGEQPHDDGLIDGKVPKKVPTMEGGEVKRFRGIPEDVPLFEVFWEQVVRLIRARPDLSIQDVTALLVSMTNLSLSCYPDRLGYVSSVLSYAQQKVAEYADSPDLHHPITTSNLLALLLAPVQSYVTVVTLLALPGYSELLQAQPFASRRSIAHAIVASVLKNETVLDDPEDVVGVLEMCHVLVKDQKDVPAPPVSSSHHPGMGGRSYTANAAGGEEEMAEEQGWLARLVHLFKSDDLNVQFELLKAAKGAFAEGGDRIRWTFPPLITASIALARRYQYCRPSMDPDLWEASITQIFKFMHASTDALYDRVLESSEVCLRLHLLALSVADEAGLAELAYEFAVMAFTIYEEGISESKAQLQAITNIIGALQNTRVFPAEDYDTLITKAALHGAKLLKKGQQATAVALASHLWWQTESRSPKSEEAQPPIKDGKRVLECLQKALRIATSCIDELTSVQLYVDALEKYLYYFERGVEAISAKHISSLIELITSNLESLPATSSAPPPSQLPPSRRRAARDIGGATSGLIEGVDTKEAVGGQFGNIIRYVQSRIEGDESGGRWEDVDVGEGARWVR